MTEASCIDEIVKPGSKPAIIYKGEKNMRLLSKMFLVVLISHLSQVLLIAQEEETQAQQIDVKAVYLLSNDHAGTGKFLTVSGNENAVVMADSSSSDNQLWKLTALGKGKYRLTNLAIGDGKSLDNIKKGDEYSVVMSDTGESTGQSWTLTRMGDGKYSLTNNLAGKGKALDNYKDGDEYSVAMGSTGDYTGQAWTLTKKTQKTPTIPDPNKKPPSSKKKS
jgi:hypothetical protein